MSENEEERPPEEPPRRDPEEEHGAEGHGPGEPAEPEGAEEPEEVEATPLEDGEGPGGPTVDAPPRREEGTRGPDTTWPVLCHVFGACGALLLPTGGGALAPLVVWLVKRDESPEVDHHGCEALNFQITYLLAGAGLAVLAMLSPILCFLIPIVFVGAIALPVGNIVLSVMASMAASEGKRYRYPWTLRLVPERPQLR
jgi:uncharacterized Tic20 family protein